MISHDKAQNYRNATKQNILSFETQQNNLSFEMKRNQKAAVRAFRTTMMNDDLIDQFKKFYKT